ncbi:membrane protein [Candidatus Magnetomorum sp. HK-1]|nr:membrane protein [Candidatus Magnetomorum sp. HK-1]
MKIKSQKKWSYAWLFVGAILMYFSNWAWAFPAATLSFLITWFASITNFAWEQQFVWRKFRKTVILYSLIISIVFLFGWGRC